MEGSQHQFVHNILIAEPESVLHVASSCTGCSGGSAVVTHYGVSEFFVEEVSKYLFQHVIIHCCRMQLFHSAWCTPFAPNTQSIPGLENSFEAIVVLIMVSNCIFQYSFICFRVVSLSIVMFTDLLRLSKRAVLIFRTTFVYILL